MMRIHPISAAHLAFVLALTVAAIHVHSSVFIFAALAGGWLLLFDSFRQDRRGQMQNALVAIAVIMVPLLVLAAAAFGSRILDANLRAADLRLGLDGFAVARWTTSHAHTQACLTIVYDTMPFVMAAAWAASRSRRLVRAAVLGALVAPICYALFPAVGPRYAFPSWPAAGSVALTAAAGARNCMPSMHWTWSTLCAYNAPPRWRVFFAIYAALTTMAVLATGEHYAVDVLAALPFTAGLQWLAGRAAGSHFWRTRVPSSTGDLSPARTGGR